MDFSSLKRVYRMKNLIVSNLSARPVGTGLLIDSDGDGIDDAAERTAGTIPARTDTDGDGFSDTIEHFFRTSGWDALYPLDADCSIKANDLNGDAIPDDIDRCPLDPEDKDGFQDEDGCPDPDNDNDGIVDAMDACPNNPGPLSNRGCPVLDRDDDGIPDDLDRCPEELI